MFDLMEETSEPETIGIRLPDIEEASGKERLQWEKELLGVYTISHPLQQLSVDIQNLVTCACNELDETYDGRNVMLAGMIRSVRTITTKKGDPMAFVQLEDMRGQCEVVVFPRTYAEEREKLIEDNVVVIKGKAQTREGQTSLLADSIQTYVERAIVGEDENSYQDALLEVQPTVNGRTQQSTQPQQAMRTAAAVVNGTVASVTEQASETGAETAIEAAILTGTDDDDGFVDDDYVPYGEENPFQSQAPAWASIRGGNATCRSAC